MSLNLEPLVIWIIASLVFIAFDILSGWIKAVSTHTFKTSVMREGLYHKIGSILAILLFVTIDILQMYYDLSAVLGFALNVTPFVCGYIILMELMSIIENICVINPEIMPEKLISILGIKEQITKFTDKTEGDTDDH